VNRTRDLVRQALVWFPDEKAHLKPALVKWVVALAQCVRLHMRAPRDATPAALAGWLSADELAGLAAAAHRPNHCLQVLSHIIATGSPEAHTAHRLDEDLKFLEDTIGGCERVYRTPIPLSYTRHTSRLLLFWLAYMPAALFSELNIQALLVAPLLVLVLFGIDEIGVELVRLVNTRRVPLQAQCARGVMALLRREASACMRACACQRAHAHALTAATAARFLLRSLCLGCFARRSRSAFCRWRCCATP
jgi:putative membrane protein